MRFKLLAVAGAASLLLLAPATADAACCEGQADQQKAVCCDMPCCKDGTAVDMLLSLNPQLNPAPPVRQTVEVWFKNATLVGRSILQGRYVIEHDNERMARGDACTHIYAYDDRTKPVVAFHCTHLERERSGDNQVVLVNTSEPGIKKLTEFQFAGETAAHGYPTVR